MLTISKKNQLWERKLFFSLVTLTSIYYSMKNIIPLMNLQILCHQICFYHRFCSLLKLTGILKLRLVFSPTSFQVKLLQEISQPQSQINYFNFLIAPDIFCNLPANKTNIFERNWSKFKVGLSPSKKICVICFIESPLKMIKNTLFHLQSSFHFQDI